MGRLRAHVHNADMSCCKPRVPTEADLDPDVLKRPCLVRGLSKSQEAFRVYEGLTGRAGSLHECDPPGGNDTPFLEGGSFPTFPGWPSPNCGWNDPHAGDPPGPGCP